MTDIRQFNGGWVVRLCKIWLQFRALTDPQIVVDKLSAEWPAVVEEDKELLLKFIEFAKSNGLIKDETALRLTNLVEDPEEEAQAGRAETDARTEQENAQAIAMAKATKPQVGAVGEMNGNGYNSNEIAAFVGAAERIVANGGV